MSTLPQSPFQAEHEGIDEELRGIRSRAGQYPFRQREKMPPTKLRNAVLPLRSRLAQMEKTGVRFSWSEKDIECARLLLEHVWPKGAA